MNKREFVKKVKAVIKQPRLVSKKEYADQAYIEYKDNGGYIEIPARDSIDNVPHVI